MKRWMLLLIIIGIFVYIYAWRAYWLMKPNFSSARITTSGFQDLPDREQREALDLLKQRRDDDAWLSFQKVLKADNNNLNALWAKAEILRRKRDYEASEKLLKELLSTNPDHARSLLSLSYIKIKAGAFSEAESLISHAMDFVSDTETAAMAYVMLGTLNATRAEKGTILDKLNYTPQIKCYFERATELAPALAEPHLALGTFYLLAPKVIGGGDLSKAFIELNRAFNIAPNFATLNARLAQCSWKKYDYGSYNSYKETAEKLDPDNEVLKEMAVR